MTRKFLQIVVTSYLVALEVIEADLSQNVFIEAVSLSRAHTDFF